MSNKDLMKIQHWARLRSRGLVWSIASVPCIMVSQRWSGNTKMRKWKGIESYQDARLITGEMSLRDPTPVDFLAQPWVMSLSHLHHFQLIFLPGHIVGAMIDHTCMTVCPSGFAINNDRITVMYTDKFGKPNTESVLCHHLALYLPQKCNVNIILLRWGTFVMWRKPREWSISTTWWLFNRSN